MSFFARMGAKIFAAKGNVEIQAQDGDISTWSTNDTLISSDKKWSFLPRMNYYSTVVGHLFGLKMGM